MAEPQEVQLHIMAPGDKETKSSEETETRNQYPTNNRRKIYYRWLRIALYTLFVLLGQSAATLLGRLYFEKGGKSKWMGTLVQNLGFPVLLPFYLISSSPPKNPTVLNHSSKQPSPQMLAFIYVSLGLLITFNCYMYSVGLSYLPVSTLSLICSTQLAFNAFFSFFLNSLHFTPYIVNSLVVLTISSALLAFQPADSGPSEIPKEKYVIGFICTLATAAGYGLVLSLTQLAFQKVIKKETFRAIMDLIVYESIAATAITIVGLFASGEWKGLKREMEGYKMGKASYIQNLTWTAILWQLFSVGCVGLIIEVSSLFSNAISVVGLPMVPILAMIFFHEKLHGIKAISMVLAVWGFVSYVYQKYLDDYKSDSTTANRNTSSSPAEEEVNK